MCVYTIATTAQVKGHEALHELHAIVLRAVRAKSGESGSVEYDCGRGQLFPVPLPALTLLT